MKQLFVLLAVIAAVSCEWTGGLRVRFDVGIGIGRTFFYDIPRSVSDATAEGWTATPRPDGPLPSLKLLCPAGRALCVLYDDTDYVAGLQIALDESQFTGALYDWQTQGFTEWTPADDGKKYRTMQQYFVTDEFLATTKEDRLAARNSNKVLQLDGVWVTGFNKDLVKISTSADQIASSIFTEQACIPWMGRHYYYNMTANTECTSEGLFPWFPLVNSGELVATGFVTYGQLPVDPVRNWFERPPRLAVQAIVPNGPQCLYDLADNPGLVTMHIYYVERPWLIQCLF